MAAFTLVELLLVIVIISMLVTLALPALSGWAGTGRKAATALVITTLEQARMSAIESGRLVAVVFWKRDYPEHDALSIWGQTENLDYSQIARWRIFPQGMILQNKAATQSLFSVAEFDNQIFADMPEKISGVSKSSVRSSLYALVFSPTGGVLSPQGNKNLLKIIVSEDTIAKNMDPNSPPSGFDIISVSQFTGRAQLDFSTDPL